MTRRELLTQGITGLSGVSDSARLDVTRVMEHVLKIDTAQLLAHDDVEVSAEYGAQVRALLQRRSLGEPVAYLCGEAWFYGRRFLVDKRVLVPRPETELFIELALAHFRSYHADMQLDVIDLGTGSGAIALTLAAECPTAQVYAVDISADALEITHQNRSLHELSQRVHLCESNLFDELDSELRCDVLTANLPYLRSDEIPQRPDPLGFEPALALDGGPDGIALYRRVFRTLRERLRPGALALFEAAPPTMRALHAAARTAFPNATLDIVSDYSGSERILTISNL